jgi:hypothetical protein
MKLSHIAIERSLRIAGILLISGLVIEAVSLVWSKPLSFLLFVGVGGFVTIIGLFVYLYSLLPSDSGSSSEFSTRHD